VAAVTLWNTAYLDRALQALQEEGLAIPEQFVPHLSPLGWEHITLTGTYHWHRTERPWGQFRPLRRDLLERLKAQGA
jgi:hypothetical protein